ncbi:DUF72 domain-containing protein [Paraburkholderia sp. WSM4177]|uniref:DUF72 domain-containing protein n=1 Tax=unclassified Paraburkholderia TaxID=2615204 RepID=UPI001831141C|nr:uncharacterized protein YecE (DUF72 family) [Paraburkholderia sp. WSM4177]MBB5488642.1 uncharacterized protein YecE (DUF72 family) [Paraburkholderia sp. WSM4180]
MPAATSAKESNKRSENSGEERGGKPKSAKKAPTKKSTETSSRSTSAARIRIGIGGWTYAPWRGPFYPEDLTQSRELEYASRHLTSIEINGTFYGLQKPASYEKWYQETPDDFVFSLKAPRYATNRKVLAEAGDTIERFFASGVLLLKQKLGPINWQFAPTKKFDADDFEAFLKLLPASIEGQKVRHAVEVRHESFRTPEFIALARKYKVAVVLAADSEYPQIADITAPFVYARIMGTSEKQANGYSTKALDAWAERARQLAAGITPDDLETCAEPPAKAATRDVYLYVISGFKERNPAAAMALLEKL